MTAVMDTERVATSARSVVCVDFDLTLVDWGPIDEVPEPLPGAIAALVELRRRGYEVVILTSRLSPDWWEAHCDESGMDPATFGAEQEVIVQRALSRMGFPDLRVTGEKVPALAYIDDRAVPFSGDWSAALARIPGGVHDQPPPIPSDRPAVWDLVIADMRERDAVGRQRYGTPLQPHNGRDPLVDAYQEALDLAVYLRQAIAEREA